MRIIKLMVKDIHGDFVPVDMFKNEEVKLSFDMMPVNKLNERKFPFSNTFTLPLTELNAKTFGYTFGNISVVNKKNECYLVSYDTDSTNARTLFYGYFDVVEVLTRGVKNYIAINVYDKAKKAIDDLSKMKFSDYLKLSTMVDADRLRDPSIPVTFSSTGGLMGDVFVDINGDRSGENKIYAVDPKGQKMTMPFAFNIRKLVKDMFSTVGVNFIGGDFFNGGIENWSTEDLHMIIPANKYRKLEEVDKIQTLKLGKHQLYDFLKGGQQYLVDGLFSSAAKLMFYQGATNSNLEEDKFKQNDYMSVFDNKFFMGAGYGSALNGFDFIEPMFRFKTQYKTFTNYDDFDITCIDTVGSRTNFKAVVKPENHIRIVPRQLLQNRIFYNRLAHDINKVTGDNLEIFFCVGSSGKMLSRYKYAEVDVSKFHNNGDPNIYRGDFDLHTTFFYPDKNNPKHVASISYGDELTFWFEFVSVGTTVFEKTDPTGVYTQMKGVLKRASWEGGHTSVSDLVDGIAIDAQYNANSPVSTQPQGFSPFSFEIIDDFVLSTGDHSMSNVSELLIQRYRISDTFEKNGITCLNVLDDIMTRYNLRVATNQNGDLVIDNIMRMFDSSIKVDIESILDSTVAMKYDKDGIKNLSISNKSTSDEGALRANDGKYGDITNYEIDVNSDKDLTLQMKSTIVNTRMFGNQNTPTESDIKNIDAYNDAMFFGFNTNEPLDTKSFGIRHCFVSDDLVPVKIYSPVDEITPLGGMSGYKSGSLVRGYRFVENPSSTRFQVKQVDDINSNISFTPNSSFTTDTGITASFVGFNFIFGGVKKDGLNGSSFLVGTLSNYTANVNYKPFAIFDINGEIIATVKIVSNRVEMTFLTGDSKTLYDVYNTMCLVNNYDSFQIIENSDQDKYIIARPKKAVFLPTVSEFKDNRNLSFGDGEKPLTGTAYDIFFKKYIDSVSITNGITVTCDVYISDDLASKLQLRPIAVLYNKDSTTKEEWFISSVENVDISKPFGGVYKITLTKSL